MANDQGDWGFTFRFLSPELLAKRLFKAAFAGDAERSKQLVALGSRRQCQVARRDHRRADRQGARLRSRGRLPGLERRSPAAAVRCQRGRLERCSTRSRPKDAPGVAVLVARDGKVLLSHGFGMADLVERRADYPDHKVPHRLGHQAVCRGRDLEASGRRPAQRERQIEQVLSRLSPRRRSHDSPLADPYFRHQELHFQAGLHDHGHRRPRATNDRFVQERPVRFRPRRQILVQQFGLFSAGSDHRKVSGKSFNDYLRDTFFEPLGMHDTGVHTATAVLKHEATGYGYEAARPTKAIDWDMSRPAPRAACTRPSRT